MKHLNLILGCLEMVALGFLLAACSVSIDQTIVPAAPAAASTAAPAAVPTAETAAVPTAMPTAVPQVTATATPNGTGPADGEAVYMVEKTKDFILVGQKDRPEAGQYHWTEEFLNLLDMESLYVDYVAAGGEADAVEGFAAYLTQNAPVPENWKEMFEAAFAEAYGLKVVKYELIQDTFYQVYVEMDGTVVPYVVVDARTGYYHG